MLPSPDSPELSTGGPSGRAAPSLVAAVLLVTLLPSSAPRPVVSSPSPRRAADTIRVTDGTGRHITLPEPPERIVSLVPSVTGILLRLGTQGRLVGRTVHDTAEALSDVAAVGKGRTPSLEKIVSLEPDLVIAWPDQRGSRRGKRFSTLFPAVYYAEQDGVEEMLATVRDAGRITGRPERADSLVSAIRGGLENVRRRIANLPRRDVFYVVWPDPPTTTGGGTYLNQIISVAGGRNVFADQDEPWPRVSVEAVVERSPDVVVAGREHGTGAGPAMIRNSDTWREVRAVREGRVVGVDADLFHRPGPHVVEAARRLAALLHPDAVPNEWKP